MKEKSFYRQHFLFFFSPEIIQASGSRDTDDRSLFTFRMKKNCFTKRWFHRKAEKTWLLNINVSMKFCQKVAMSWG